jgi:hypothetical protein
MLKRIKDRFTTETHDINKVNEYGFRPSEEEMQSGLSFSKISELKRKYDFQGEYHCQLCPNKLLNTPAELKHHLASKV